MNGLEGITGFLLGMVWGSFINLCIDRFQMAHLADHERILNDPLYSERLKDHLRQARFSPLAPSRSFCFFCGHILRIKELVPLLSYLFSRGRCLSCGQAYGIRSFFVELTHALFFGALFVWLERWPAIIILALDFSLIWLVTTCHDCRKMGGWLKGLAVLMIFLNPILLMVLEF